ncbi:hypothetical protein evm_013890 [Chilo suppressalis]|nr:hypothetical protein evm_013890 [Chilo suppressalis]
MYTAARYHRGEGLDRTIPSYHETRRMRITGPGKCWAKVKSSLTDVTPRMHASKSPPVRNASNFSGVPAPIHVILVRDSHSAVLSEPARWQGPSSDNVGCSEEDHARASVGFGRNCTLFAMEAGRVVITCERFQPNWDHNWVKLIYGGREQQTIFKKYFNVIPEPQHNRFILYE